MGRDYYSPRLKLPAFFVLPGSVSKHAARIRVAADLVRAGEGPGKIHHSTLMAYLADAEDEQD